MRQRTLGRFKVYDPTGWEVHKKVDGEWRVVDICDDETGSHCTMRTLHEADISND
jgi:hypothetical protein